MTLRSLAAIGIITALAVSGCSQKNNPTGPEQTTQGSVTYGAQTWQPTDCLLSEEFIGSPGQDISAWDGGTGWDAPFYGNDGNTAKLYLNGGLTSPDIILPYTYTVMASQPIANADLAYYNRLRILTTDIQHDACYSVYIKSITANGYIGTFVGTTYNSKIGYMDVELPQSLQTTHNSIVVQIQMDSQGHRFSMIEIGEIYIYHEDSPTIYWEDTFSNGISDHPEGWWDGITHNDNAGKMFLTDMKRTLNDTATIELMAPGRQPWGKVISPPVSVTSGAFDNLSLDVLDVALSSNWKLFIREMNGSYRTWELTGQQTVSGDTYTYDLSALPGFSTVTEMSIELVIEAAHSNPVIEFDNIKLHL